ncbi:MAG: hypothetical protein LKH74_05635 [Levilactobacillus sp.]|jgi:ABC-type glycerol-3-phosphate transport system substrate-binding protein|uniref:Uncharacterized protein n=1 Tax=Levilactobacillus suantsaiihabitans TaxID=2487722 RepID=A0A4Z0JAG8_9LACO|nr:MULTISPECIES: hypothetical protein [Levilactobacillus]MCI1553390.1 hypothetical protein [Levilactobacillus sp.]MCI1599075.1 hypothetical protein [Levilactobacillus sp.]MCI1606844.1 hypothetical protein [Levilactobacillus sp.]TGD19770.1 hypothetical protein EGT51_02745 [Levilactobacillus suantsaiihabitans]
MTKVKTMMTKALLGAMTVTTLLATSAGASAAVKPATAAAAPTIERTTITLNPRPNTEVQVIKIRLKKPTTTKQLSQQVQTNVDASALSLDQRHTDSQLK